MESIGEVKNTTKHTVTLLGTREKVTVIPDAITDTKVIEIKDVKSLSNTKQIRGERQAAQKEGKDFTIITGEKTHVSGNIPDGEIVRRKDIGPQ
ncbi:putative toxin [Bacteroides sp.]